MKSFTTLALIGLTTLFIGCSSSDSDTMRVTSASDLPVPANAPAAQPTEALPSSPVPSAVTQDTAPAAAAPVNVATVDYTVVSGDSLWKIARDHRTSVAKIKSLNDLSGDKIIPGQVIKVPSAQ